MAPKGELAGVGRSSWKLPHFDRFISQYVRRQMLAPRDPRRVRIVSTYTRYSPVPEILVRHKFAVHNGRSFLRVVLLPEHVGHKFGSLILSKTIGERVHNDNRMARKKQERSRTLQQKKRSVRVKGKGVKKGKKSLKSKSKGGGKK